jgi:predicted permease
MENLAISFNVVAPIILMLLTGVILRKVGLLPESACGTLNTLTYKVLIPVSIFCNVYNGDLSKMLDIKPVLYAAAVLTVEFLVMMAVVRFIEPEHGRRGVMVQAVIRSNFVIFGIPVATSLLGDTNLNVIMLMVVLLAPYYNFLAVLAFSLNGQKKVTLKRVCKDIVTNPIIIGSLIAMAFLFLRIPLPDFVLKTIDSFGDMASPIAFMILGATFSFKMSKSVAKSVFLSVAARIVIAPAIFVPLSVILGFRGEALIGLVALFGAPTAVASYALATHMGGDGETASKIIVYSSCLSTVTMFVTIFILKQLMLI